MVLPMYKKTACAALRTFPRSRQDSAIAEDILGLSNSVLWCAGIHASKCPDVFFASGGQHGQKCLKQVDSSVSLGVGGRGKAHPM